MKKKRNLPAKNAKEPENKTNLLLFSPELMRNQSPRLMITFKVFSCNLNT